MIKNITLYQVKFLIHHAITTINNSNMKITRPSVKSTRAALQTLYVWLLSFVRFSDCSFLLLLFATYWYLDVYDTSFLYTRLYKRLYRLQQHKSKFCFERIYYNFFLSIMLREACGIFKRSELQLKSLTQHLTIAWGECPNTFFTTIYPHVHPLSFKGRRSRAQTVHTFDSSLIIKSNFKSPR